MLFGGSILAVNLTNGMDNMSKRLGADILVVPAGYDKSVQDILLTGHPSSFYINGSIQDKIARVNGVKTVSPQLYIATLSATCCSASLQLIGFDPNSDFVIQPWISKRVRSNILNNEIVVGGNVGAKPGDVLKFYGRKYRVVACMDKTGTGLDASVFMNMNTARKVIFNNEKLSSQYANFGKTLISSLSIKVEKSYDINEVASNILKNYGEKGIDVIVSKNMLSSISNNLHTFLLFIDALIIVFWLLAIIVLTTVFAVILNERKREISILRSIGATRKKISRIILCESSLISLIGSLVGIFFACLILFPFNAFISTSLKLPYLLPSFLEILVFLLASFLISFSVGPIASIFAAFKIGKSETYTMMQED